MRMSVLRADYIGREQVLKRDVQMYVKQLTPMNMIKKYLTPSTLLKADDKLNISNKVISWVLPFLMNSTIFKGSGLITRALVGIASNKIGKKVDADSILSVVDAVKAWFSGPKLKIKKKPAYVDYGIPPDSETY